MVWNKGWPATTARTADDPPLPPAPLTARRDTAQEDAAIDTVVGVLRTLGQHPLPVGEGDPHALRLVFETWARHLAIGGPHPDDRAAAGEDERAPLTATRDWLGARRFVQTRREEECQQVARTVGLSHRLIWDMTDQLAQSLLDTQERDRDVLDQLERLRAAISTGSLEAIESEVGQVARTLTDAMQEREQRLQGQLTELGARVADLSEQLQEVRLEGSLDGLTRLANRAAFERAIKRWHHVGSSFRRPTVLILADVDNLKTINDRHGHRAGDAALKVFADCLARSFPRRSDFVGRFGGDEFVVLLAETPARAGLRLAERFRQRVHESGVEHGGQRISLTTSVGLAELDPTETIESWLERADQALYRAKELGRDQLILAPPPD